MPRKRPPSVSWQSCLATLERKNHEDLKNKKNQRDPETAAYLRGRAEMLEDVKELFSLFFSWLPRK